MTRTPSIDTQREDSFGLWVAARLSEGTQGLPRDIAERLRAARVQATMRRKAEATRLVRTYALAGGLGEGRPGVWSRLASGLPVVMLAVGLVAIDLVQNERRASEVAEVDAALLTDDLPPAAYADPGFVHFLKN